MSNSRTKYIATVTICVLLVAFLLSAFAGWQIYNYEQGVAELYAQEQDGYVEIVARQIERYGDVAGDKFVEDTIEMLDKTSQRYWTLDNSQYFLFVKSINETDIYKTFSTDTFFNTKSAQSFLQILKKGQVTHSIIRLENIKYVASGIIFEYGGTEYRLCLLTDYDVMLTNNAYLSSKLYLLIDLILMIAIIVIACIFFAVRLSGERKKVNELQAAGKQLNKYIDFLDNAVMGRNSTAIITGEGKIMHLIHRMEERRIYPCTFVDIKLDTDRMIPFYEAYRESFKKGVVWLRYSKDKYMLIFGKMKKDDAIACFDSTVAEWKRGYGDSGIEVRSLEASAATGVLTVYRTLAAGSLGAGNREDN
ncbi:MAG: hypothetical protein K5869_09470 [Saccharofermentans sp.]|nr:hypothetical protein [Saccharofermentans sp.]